MNLDQFLRLQQVTNEVAVNLPERGHYAALSAAHHPYNFEIVPGFCKAEVVLDAETEGTFGAKVTDRDRAKADCIALVEASLVPAAEAR